MEIVNAVRSRKRSLADEVINSPLRFGVGAGRPHQQRGEVERIIPQPRAQTSSSPTLKYDVFVFPSWIFVRFALRKPECRGSPDGCAQQSCPRPETSLCFSVSPRLCGEMSFFQACSMSSGVNRRTSSSAVAALIATMQTALGISTSVRDQLAASS